MFMLEKNDIKETIKELACEVMHILGSGYNEVTYEKAFAHELRLSGIPYERQTNIEILYKGYYVGDVKSDVIVDKKILIELKAANPNKNHLKQAEVYMRSLNIKEGIVIGYPKKEKEVKFKDIQIENSLDKEKQIKVAKRAKKESVGKLDKVLKNSATAVLDYFGTEFMFTDAKFDIYKEALGVEFKLRNMDYKKGEAPLFYKDLKVDTKTIDFIINDSIGILPFPYKKDEDIEKQREEGLLLLSVLNLSKVYITAFPIKEESNIMVESIVA